MENHSKDVKAIQHLLPCHYECAEKVSGIECYSKIGLNDQDNDSLWKGFVHDLQSKFGNRLTGINHLIPKNHRNFTVSLKD